MLRTGLFLSHHTTLLAAALLLSPAAFAQARPPATSPAPVTAQPVAPPPVATPAPAATPAADECFPACRAGYVCARGQCVSSCNPPCASHEVCTATGECVATAPAPAPAAPVASNPQGIGAQPGYAAPAVQPGAQQMDLTTPEPPPAEEVGPEIRTFSFVPRIAILGTGSGSMEQKCTGEDCDLIYAYTEWPIYGSGSAAQDYDHKPAFALGADFMFKLGELFRIGPGLLHTFNMETKADLDGLDVSSDLGSRTDLNFVAEVIPRVGRNVWLIPRVQIGLSMLTPSGTMNNLLKDYKDYCNINSDVFTGCNSLSGPYFGPNVALGIGAMFAVGPRVRLRVDGMYQHYAISGWDVKVQGGNANATSSISGGRSLLMGGVEF